MSDGEKSGPQSLYSVNGIWTSEKVPFKKCHGDRIGILQAEESIPAHSRGSEWGEMSCLKLLR